MLRQPYTLETPGYSVACIGDVLREKLAERARAVMNAPDSVLTKIAARHDALGALYLSTFRTTSERPSDTPDILSYAQSPAVSVLGGEQIQQTPRTEADRRRRWLTLVHSTLGRLATQYKPLSSSRS